ncbi:MAG: VanZ family protein [Erysipelotrichaceae bacterium]|nr:VanZ family protein [Erysipelotrichaceae bacterium]
MKFGLMVNVLVTLMSAVMVVFMPLVDRAICKKLRISPDDRVNENPKADHYLHLRKYLLIFVFLIYLFLLSYVAFFSRTAADDYLIHIAFYEDLANAIKVDFGILGLLKVLFTEGFAAAASHVRINKIDDIVQVYLNIVLFLPMGYLLPYVFDFFRRDMKVRTILACFICSLLIENIQLMTRLGFYDIDDLVSNTLGGILGLRFYIWFAYVLAHPDFRKEAKRQKRFEQRAKEKAMYPFLSKISLQRSVIYAKDKKEVFDFYENRLGFRLRKAIPQGEDIDYMFELGKDQFEVRCRKDYKEETMQEILIACNNSEYLKQSLEESGIATSPYAEDPYTLLRTFSFMAPGNTKITVIEE